MDIQQKRRLLQDKIGTTAQSRCIFHGEYAEQCRCGRQQRTHPKYISSKENASSAKAIKAERARGRFRSAGERARAKSESRERDGLENKENIR